MYGTKYKEGLILTDSQVNIVLGVEQIVSSAIALNQVSAGGSSVAVAKATIPTTNVLKLKTALTVARELQEKAVEEFKSLPLYQWCVNNASLIGYKTWWYMGTNIYAVTKGGDRGRTLWHDFSQLDSGRYNPQECDRQFDEMTRYFGRGKGPVTYKRFRDQIGEQKWALVFNNAGPSPSSSPAGRANKNSRRRLPALVQQSKDAEEGPMPPDKVFQILAKKQIGPKDSKETIVNKGRIDNLETILRVDEHFHSRLRCDLLGAIDRWDHPTQGEKTANDPDCFTDARSYISKHYSVDFGDLETRKWFTAASFKSAYHPVQDYLYSLTWDGVDRISDLIECLSCEVTEYTRLIARKWLISAVVRPLQLQTANVRDYAYLDDGRRKPMKVDNTLVLMGEQGSGDWGGKTAFFETMSVKPDWYTDFLPSITKNRKDAALTVLDSWIVEMGEVDDYKSKNDEGTMKRFLSSTREKFRRPYDTGNKSWWRGCVFVGTTNKKQFLNDPTGDRRYWVLPVGQTVDVPRIQAIRDQLWAQAVYLFESGEVWWLMGAERELQERMNAEFRCLDATEEYIREWVASKNPQYLDADGKFGPKNAVYSGGITPLEIAQGALGKLLGDANNADLQRIGMTMHNLGYKKVRKTVDGIAKKFYIKT
jgi:predicted P-loop ATPase